MMTLGAAREVKTQRVPPLSLPSPTPPAPALLVRPDPDSIRARHDRLKDLILTVAVVGLAGVVLLSCLVAAISGEGSPEDKTWAKAVVIGVIAGFFGFQAGRHSRAAEMAVGGR